jgi:hypothetical protein
MGKRKYEGKLGILPSWCTWPKITIFFTNGGVSSHGQPLPISVFLSWNLSLRCVCVLGEEKKMEERGERERSFVKKIGEEEEKWGRKERKGERGCCPPKREGRKRERKEIGKRKKRWNVIRWHVAPCDWLGEDNEIHLNQPDCDTWQCEISFI